MGFDFHLGIRNHLWTGSVWFVYVFSLFPGPSEIAFLNMSIEHDLWSAKLTIRYSKDRENVEASSTHCQGT